MLPLRLPPVKAVRGSPAWSKNITTLPFHFFLGGGGVSDPDSSTRTLLGQKQTLVPPKTALSTELCAKMETSPGRELRTKPVPGPP